MSWIVKSVIASFALCSIFHDVKSAGLPENKFRVDEAIVNVPENPWVSRVEVFVENGGYSVTVNGTIIKQFPEDMMLTTEIQFQGVNLPKFEMLLCSAMYDQIFVNDVLTKAVAGTPPVPSSCPIDPNEIGIIGWHFPHYKIPPPTPPGSVKVHIEIFSGDIKAVVLDAKGVVVKDLDVVKMLGARN